MKQKLIELIDDENFAAIEKEIAEDVGDPFYTDEYLGARNERISFESFISLVESIID